MLVPHYIVFSRRKSRRMHNIHILKLWLSLLVSRCENWTRH